MFTHVVAIDIGGTQLRAALIDAQGNIHARAKDATLAQEGLEPVLDRIKRLVRQIMTGTKPSAIGISAPGPINPWTGTLYRPPNLPGWESVPLKDILEKEFGLSVQAGNDANVAALAEQRWGAGQGTQDLIYLTISTGIGSGVISRGKLVLGRDGFAVEAGHTTVDPDGPLCGCGNHGCLESLASGPAMASYAVGLIANGRSSLITQLVENDLGRVAPPLIGEAARRGDPLAQEVIKRAAFYMGLGIANLINIFNPELIIVGGGVTHLGDLLFEPMRAVALSRCMSKLGEGVRIVPAALGDDVALLGAAALVLV